MASPIYFPCQTQFREWLAQNHVQKTELLVGFYKVNSGKPSMTWSQSVDEALCFGWIDGVRKSIDEERYCIRFTPRKPTSIWSAINIKKVDELSKSGQMTSAGQKAFDMRTENKSGVYSHENAPASLDPNYEKLFKKNKVAWKFFKELAPSYKRMVTHWIMTAKQEKTRLSRLEKLIKVSEQQKKIL